MLNAHTGLCSSLITLNKFYLLPLKWILNLIIKLLILDENSVNIFQNKDDLDEYNKTKGK